MFKNAGEKIQVIAITLFVTSILFSTILSIYLSVDTNNAKWLLIIPITIIISFPSNLYLYAFGELCEDIKKISVITVHNEKKHYYEKKQQKTTIKCNENNDE